MLRIVLSNVCLLHCTLSILKFANVFLAFLFPSVSYRSCLFEIIHLLDFGLFFFFWSVIHTYTYTLSISLDASQNEHFQNFSQLLYLCIIDPNILEIGFIYSLFGFIGKSHKKKKTVCCEACGIDGFHLPFLSFGLFHLSRDVELPGCTH